MGTGSIYNCGKNADFPHFPLSVVKLETTLITNKIEHCAITGFSIIFMGGALVPHMFHVYASSTQCRTSTC